MKQFFSFKTVAFHEQEVHKDKITKEKHTCEYNLYFLRNDCGKHSPSVDYISLVLRLQNDHKERGPYKPASKTKQVLFRVPIGLNAFWQNIFHSIVFCMTFGYLFSISFCCLTGMVVAPASFLYGIWISQSGAMAFVLNLDNVSLKKLFPTMNI